MELSSKIKDRILKDNEFSLGLALKLGIKQKSLETKVHRNSEALLLPKYTEYYKQNGFTEDEIIKKTEQPTL